MTYLKIISTYKENKLKIRRMLKAPLLNPRAYISQSSKISPKERHFYFWTNLAPILVELIVKHIMRPKNSKARLFFGSILSYRSDNYILLLINVGPRN